MPLTTVTCLFVSDKGLSVKLIPQPVPDAWCEVFAPAAGMLQACLVLGIKPLRTFKRTAEGGIPVFEEA